MGRFWLLVAVALALAACGSNPGRRTSIAVSQANGAAEPDAASSEPAQRLQCVPYARQMSGVALYGDAWTWWDQAEPQYQRGSLPGPRAVLVLQRTQKLRQGHVAVVADVLDPRAITVSHANWGWDDKTRGRVHDGMRVVDVSSGNDWTAVRFWNEGAGAWGGVYPAMGFIYPPAAPAPADPIGALIASSALRQGG